jgi:hypothetical protein
MENYQKLYENRITENDGISQNIFQITNNLDIIRVFLDLENLKSDYNFNNKVDLINKVNEDIKNIISYIQ